MKEFMMIFIGEPYDENAMSPEEMQTYMGKWWAWHEKMEKQGILRGGHALQPTTRRIAGPDRAVTDRFAPETKELVGGYYVIEVESYEKAMEVAQDYPDYEMGGTVEIREVMVFDQ